MLALPAARVTDSHVCPIPTHVGYPVVEPCAVTVKVTGWSSARILDFGACNGPSDPIARGAATVLVAGLPAARQGDPTAHGGLVTSGEPTVLIGDPSVTLKVDSR